MRDTIRDRVRQYVIGRFDVAAGSVIGDGDSLYDRGVLGVEGMLEVIGFLEETFAIEITEADVLAEDLDSIETLTALVERKLSEHAA